MPQAELYYHPLASFCWKALVGLYELDVPFTPITVDLGNAAERATLEALWPMGRFPVLKDAAGVVAESSIILEHIGIAIPSLECRARDRFFDLDIHAFMQRVVSELRTNGADSKALPPLRAQIRKAYAYLETWIGDAWACGDAFTLADCAAAPALWYADKVAPMRGQVPRTAAYLQRLIARPSFARVLREAEPFMKYFPGVPD